ncbi:MAG: sugar phosphate isomerase/epimerase, partial [Clostridia bacterium]|nr:sugar phosphate isomerase/epimerase [Clostridia bacterium]
MKIGIISDSLRLGFAESVKKAASLGAQGIKKYMTYGDIADENLTPARLAEIRDIMDSNGIVFSAI